MIICKFKKNLKICLFTFFTISTSSCSMNSQMGHVEEISSMNIPRVGSTSVKLKDGNVLILGGTILDEAIGNKKAPPAEIYDIKTKMYQKISPMNLHRYGFTATLLQNGKVLVVGGKEIGVEITSSIEIFDPETKKFYLAGSLPEPRAYHSAIPLKNGNVLFIAGENNKELLKSIVQYDFEKQEFKTIGQISNVGGYSTGSYTRALLLKDGKILIGGGARDGSLVSDLEVYDPETHKTTTAGSLNDMPPFVWTLMPDGKILYINSTALQAAIYDLNTKTSKAAGDFKAIDGISAIQLLKNGKILISGSDNPMFHISELQIYDPAVKSFNSLNKYVNAYPISNMILLDSGDVLLPDVIPLDLKNTKTRLYVP